MNGIAYDSNTGDFWITGKNWTSFHRISIMVESSEHSSMFEGRILIVLIVISSLLFPLFGSLFYSVREPKGIQASPHVAEHGGGSNG